jgi:hypothetical protein
MDPGTTDGHQLEPIETTRPSIAPSYFAGISRPPASGESAPAYSSHPNVGLSLNLTLVPDHGFTAYRSSHDVQAGTHLHGPGVLPPSANSLETQNFLDSSGSACGLSQGGWPVANFQSPGNISPDLFHDPSGLGPPNAPTGHVQPQLWHAPPHFTPHYQDLLLDTSLGSLSGSSVSLAPPRKSFKDIIPYAWIKHGVPGMNRARTNHACEPCRQRKTKVRIFTRGAAYIH